MMVVMRRRCLQICMSLLVASVTACTATASSHHSRKRNANATRPGDFDYYVLSLSWAPAFCASHSGQGTSRECDPKRHVGFVVHGLWPQKEGSRVENCGSVPPVSSAIVNEMLPLMPSAGLIQHEWQTHGSCSGLNAQDYFSLIRQVRSSIQIPSDFQNAKQDEQKGVSAIEQDFVSANHLSGPGAVRVACYSAEMTEVRLCVTKDGQSRTCSKSVAECNTGTVEIRPIP
jgi:ribonuclease T2